MINGMLEASRGCLKEEVRMDVIANNLANSAGIGFKKDRVSFQQMLDQEISEPQQITETGLKRDPYLVTVNTDMSEGDVQTTGNELDLAITGEGFFKISTTDGIRYTRKGNFALDSAGNLVTQDGNPVLGKSGTINVPISDVKTGSVVMVIDDQGSISFDDQIIDQLDIVKFDDTKNLVKAENNLFRNDSEDPEVAVTGDTAVKQGYIELSNVNVAEEMVNMVHSMRAFESYQKAIKAIDELNDKAINQVGRLR
jgi:flagellar basal-body rod protein FlgF